MAKLQRRIDAQARKLDDEYSILESMLDRPVDEQSVGLTLSQAKRVRRESTALVRVLARGRDEIG